MDVLIPARCLGCPELVDRQGNLCPTCWKEVTFIDAPQCDICGYPFEHPLSGDAICAGCLQDPPPYKQARSLMAYEGVSRKIILAFKHGDDLHMAPYLARWLSKFIPDDTDFIAPVPLHWVRLFQRGYNQSALISNALSGLMDFPCTPELLVRTRNTPTQGGLTHKKRKENMRSAFSVPNKNLTIVKGKAIVLVDDVLTTGATRLACTRTLKKAGARSVSLVTIARVVQPHRGI